MVKTSLVERDLLEGRRFLDALKEQQELKLGRRKLKWLPASHFRLEAAFWCYLPDSREWRLVIATPLVDEQGPLVTYRDVRLVLSQNLDLDLSLQNISVVSPKEPLVKAFKKAMKMARDPLGTRFTHSTIEGNYVEDAYVYRLPN
jgi:hypothetical protein